MTKLLSIVMADKSIVKQPSLALESSAYVIPGHLTENELNALTSAFQKWAYSKKQVCRSRYWLVFLFLRWTGARLSEVLMIDEGRDLDFSNSTVRLRTLKQQKKSKPRYRIVPVPDRIMMEYLKLTKLYPKIERKAFSVKRTNFYVIFKRIALDVGIPANLAHPHILRHTRAIELLRAHVPVTAVQQLLGHSSLNTTAIYLRYSNTEVALLLKQLNLI